MISPLPSSPVLDVGNEVPVASPPTFHQLYTLQFNFSAWTQTVPSPVQDACAPLLLMSALPLHKPYFKSSAPNFLLALESQQSPHSPFLIFPVFIIHWDVQITPEMKLATYNYQNGNLGYHTVFEGQE